MADYITDGLTTDPDEILTGMIADFQERMPDWVPSEAAPEVILMGILAARHAVRLDVDSQVLTAIFRYFGLSIAGVPPEEPSYARADATVTLIDDAGYTIPDGTRLTINLTGNTSVAFLTDGDTTAAPGATSVVVPIIAQNAGAAGSGLTGSVTNVDGLDYITGITLVAATSGGQDGETDAEYLERLARRQRRTSDKIITAEDAELAILDEITGVGRVLVLDNYVPAIGADPEAFDVPGAFTVVIATSVGGDVPSDTKTEVEALLERDRILDLAAYVINPTRTDVTVAYTATAYDTYVPAEVAALADAAVTDYMSGTGWGTGDVTAGGPTWVEDLTVRYSELYAVLDAVQGINHVTDVKINGVSNTNVTIAGPGALPNLTSVTGTVA